MTADSRFPTLANRRSNHRGYGERDARHRNSESEDPASRSMGQTGTPQEERSRTVPEEPAADPSLSALLGDNFSEVD